MNECSPEGQKSHVKVTARHVSFPLKRTQLQLIDFHQFQCKKDGNIHGGPKTGTLFVRLNFMRLNFIKYLPIFTLISLSESEAHL